MDFFCWLVAILRRKNKKTRQKLTIFPMNFVYLCVVSFHAKKRLRKYDYHAEDKNQKSPLKRSENQPKCCYLKETLTRDYLSLSSINVFLTSYWIDPFLFFMNRPQIEKWNKLLLNQKQGLLYVPLKHHINRWTIIILNPYVWCLNHQNKH